MERLALLSGSYYCDTQTFGVRLYLEELYNNWRMLHFENMRKKFLLIQHPNQIPFLQKFRMVRHET